MKKFSELMEKDITLKAIEKDNPMMINQPCKKTSTAQKSLEKLCQLIEDHWRKQKEKNRTRDKFRKLQGL